MLEKLLDDQMKGLEVTVKYLKKLRDEYMKENL